MLVQLAGACGHRHSPPQAADTSGACLLPAGAWLLQGLDETLIRGSLWSACHLGGLSGLWAVHTVCVGPSQDQWAAVCALLTVLPPWPPQKTGHKQG